MKMSPVVHFEMPAVDKKRMAEFYSKTFGWKTNQLGPEMGNYVVVQTGETDEKGMLNETNRINGGFVDKSEDFQSPSLVIAVEDIHAAMKNVTQRGGKVIGGQKPGVPDNIPGIGLYIAIVDTEGNRVGMLQPSAQM